MGCDHKRLKATGEQFETLTGPLVPCVCEDCGKTGNMRPEGWRPWGGSHDLGLASGHYWTEERIAGESLVPPKKDA